jgi:hypothetical protein
MEVSCSSRTRVVTEAQLEYNESPDLRALLRRAAASKTVGRARRDVDQRTPDVIV